MGLGVKFEREIREQPEVWERIARSDAAVVMASAFLGEIVLVGSGSSLFEAQVGALALRRRGYEAHALAASESHADHNAYLGKTVVAISQSGESSDVLRALDQLQPKRTIALTNTKGSPLAARADITINIGAGIEEAIPATKTVTASVAVLLRAASLAWGEHGRDADALMEVAQRTRSWLATGLDDVREAGERIAKCRDVLFLGTDYGSLVAREAALKFKEASYQHAEGFAAGEFRHGSVAMVDADSAVIGFVDRDGAASIISMMAEVEDTNALRLAVGTVDVPGIPRLGPIVADAYDVLAWLITVQFLALYSARARGIDSDNPRGLKKAIVTE